MNWETKKTRKARKKRVNTNDLASLVRNLAKKVEVENDHDLQEKSVLEVHDEEGVELGVEVQMILNEEQKQQSARRIVMPILCL
jgi:hypothetical protein